jgi:hypothetical protein
VCSTTASRIARICAAIEELTRSSPEPGSGGLPKPGSGGPGVGTSASAVDDDVADRLAAIWAMIADIDPGVAKRLPGYLAAAEQPPGRRPSVP